MMFWMVAAAWAGGPVLEVDPHAPSGGGSVDIIMKVASGLGLGDQVVPSDGLSSVVCKVTNGTLRVVFESAASDWPTSLPDEVTCTVGGQTWVIPVAWRCLGHISGSAERADDGLFVSLIPASMMVGARVGRTPVTTLQGTWPARRSPTAIWEGVDCTVAVDGVLELTVGLEVDGADGYCEVPAADRGEPFVIDVAFERL